MFDSPTKASERGFFQRQVSPDRTSGQDTFDWIFGVVLPVICFVADPIVFKTGTWLFRNHGEPALAEDFKVFAYTLCFVSVMAMAAWLTWAKDIRCLCAPFAGLFATGALISLLVGIALFPLSLVGLIVIIGALGFTPFFSSIVFFRNSIRAFKRSGEVVGKGLRLRVAILAALFAFAVPFAVNQEFSSRNGNGERNEPTVQSGAARVHEIPGSS